MRSGHFRYFISHAEHSPISISSVLADGHWTIGRPTIGVPHPYTMEFARTWISSHSAAWEDRRALHWAALKAGDNRIAGYAGLNKIDNERGQAELRCWVGCGVARKRDAVEWSEAIVTFAFTGLNLNRIYALQLARHPLAGRVLAAIGMQREGMVRMQVDRGGMAEDVVCWAIVSSDWPGRALIADSAVFKF
jgi:ribosomal-protein-alanine N-acetyltransferase